MRTVPLDYANEGSGDEIEDWLKIRNDYSAHAQKIGPFARELWGEWRMCALVANKFDTEY